MTSFLTILLAATIIGWRGDATGRYPTAKPSTEFSTEKNVVWATALSDRSNASPVLSGDRLFICAEPAKLICINAVDGKILWEKTNNYSDAQIPDGDKQPLPRTHETNGYSSPTPVTDGKFVYALFGNGVAACYNMAGQRQWIKFVEAPTADWGQSSSPVLVGGNLVVLINSLTALDAATGTQRWRCEAKQRWGSPVTARVGKLDVVLTPAGDVVRVSDGKILAAGLASLDYCAPVVHDGIVYFIQRGGKAVKLSPTNDDGVKTEALWTTQPKSDRYYASPVWDNGLIYAVNQKAEFSVIDALTGEVVHERKLALAGTVYPSVTLAGGYLFVGSEGGTTIVLEPGRDPKEVAVNKLSHYRSSPVFAGNLMYLRAFDKLYCIGR